MVLLESIQISNLPEDVNIVVKDDSGLRFCEAIESRFKNNSKISFFYNEENMGYARSFFDAFRQIRSEFIMFASDDDAFDQREFNKTMQKLRHNPVSCVSTKWYYKNKSTGRNVNHSLPCKFSLFNVRQSTNHAPGLIWHRSSALPFIKSLDLELENNSTFVYFYPQVSLAYCLLFVAKTCEIWPYSPFNEGPLSQPSNLTALDSQNSYIHPSEALKENLSVNEFLIKYLSQYDQNKALILADLNQAKLFQDVAFSLRLMDINIYNLFIGDSLFYVIRYHFFRIPMLLGKLVLLRLRAKAKLHSSS